MTHCRVMDRSGDATPPGAGWSGPIAAVGHVTTGYRAHADTPVQSMLNPDERGRVVLQPRSADGLPGLEGFDAAWLLTWLAPLDTPAGHTVAPPPRNGWFDIADLDAPHTPSSLDRDRPDST